MSQLLGQCVGLISGPEWRDVRGVTEVPFLHKTTPNYLSLVTRVTERYFQNLHANGDLNKGLIDPAGDLKLLPFWVIAEIVYGELSVEQEMELTQLVPLREEVFRHVVNGGVVRMWWSKYLPIEANRAFNEFKTRWLAFNNAAYERAIQLGSEAPIISMYKAAENGTIGKEQLYQTLDEMLYANLDVTTGGISWCLVFLAANQRVQEKLREEVKFSNKEDREKYLLRSSTFLSACISESSRLKPLAAFSVPQSAPTDRVVSGFNIPAGTDFIVDSYALNIRNEFWGPDRTSYRPERFLELNATNMRYNFWRFGFGPRQCMGKYVADLIIRVLLEHLVTNYELDLLDAHEKWQRNPETWITLPKMQVKCIRRES
jgi:cytochrome P450